MKQGFVSLIGAGPGDPGLLTIRGRERLAAAEVIVYDHLAAPRLLEYAPPGAERIYVGKEAAAHTLRQEEINQLLVSKAQEGLRVARLKGGDPFVFGRGGEEALALVEAGVPFEIIPGITAGIAAAAYAGIPATHRGMATSVSLITGHESPDKAESTLDWPSLARMNGTLAFYMGLGNLPYICENLIANGRTPETPVALIRWGTTASQEVVTGTLQTITDRSREAGLKPPVIILVGDVVNLRDRLTWFESRPLFGQRVIVTRSRTQASGLSSSLEDLGAEVIELPTIRITPPDDPAPLREAVDRLADFNWIIFMSVNAVEAFFAALAAAGRDTRALAGCRVCAVGPVTIERLAGFGVHPDAAPSKFTGRNVVEVLGQNEPLKGTTLLYPRADIAPGEIITDLKSHGAAVTDIIAYRTMPDSTPDAPGLTRLRAGEMSWITFTSSSTVKNLLALIDGDAIRKSGCRLASIGPSTSATMREAGLEPTVEAAPHTIPGLVDALANYSSVSAGRG